MSFQKLQALLSEVFHETIQNETELTYSSATLVLSCIFQLYSRAPKYALYKQRILSFQENTEKINNSYHDVELDRPSSPLPPSASEFASAGFFHVGEHDETVCAVCGLGLRDWQPVDKADECHTLFAQATAITISEALRSNEDEPGECVSTAIPCLFVEVHRLLVSRFPLRRKNLINDEADVEVGMRVGSLDYIRNLASRLEAIKKMMTSTSSLSWPVKNARNLGYSEDLIALGLWRRQADGTSTPISFVPSDSMKLSPQDTALLLKSILRVQEGGLEDEDGDLPFVENEVSSIAEYHPTNQSPQETLINEDAELETLTRNRVQLASESTSAVHPNSKLPGLAELLFWWFDKWSDQVSKTIS